MYTQQNMTLLNKNSKFQCVICEAKLSPTIIGMKHDEDRVCKSFDCQRILRSKESLTPYLFKNKVAFYRQLLKEKKQTEEALKSRLKIKQAHEQEESSNIEVSILLKHKKYGQKPEAYPTLKLPIGPKTTVNLSKRRVTNYTHHLYKIISEAFSLINFTPSVSPDTFVRHKKMTHLIDRHPNLEKLNDQYCSTCKGGCCVKGGEKAYLSVDSIRRIKQQQPTLRPEALLNIFLSSLSNKVIKGSCINHTSQGCALNREYRSEICNRFYCDELHDYAEKYSASPESISGGLVINRQQNLWSSKTSKENKVVGVSIVEPTKIEVISLG